MNKVYARVVGKKVSFAKAVYILVILLGCSIVSSAQHVLLVNDNDNIVANSDTIVSDMNFTSYSSYHYWSIPDSSYICPTAAYMATFDLVIWYCSTDGVGLQFWNGTGTTGNADLITYSATGKPLWIIGQDILYSKYPTTPAPAFTTGEFPKDIMGLASYDVQSYVDDANAGCPEADRLSTASTLFPNKLLWQFSTLWYVDGCTADTGTRELYQMGPSTYSLYGKKCTFHNKRTGISVMSTLFDPALIDSFDNRVNFLDKGITYLLSPTTGLQNAVPTTRTGLYPNPATSAFSIKLAAEKTSEVAIEIFDLQGRKVSRQRALVNAGETTVSASLDGVAAGIYLVKVTDAEGKVVYMGKLEKE